MQLQLRSAASGIANQKTYAAEVRERVIRIAELVEMSIRDGI